MFGLKSRASSRRSVAMSPTSVTMASFSSSKHSTQDPPANSIILPASLATRRVQSRRVLRSDALLLLTVIASTSDAKFSGATIALGQFVPGVARADGAHSTVHLRATDKAVELPRCRVEGFAHTERETSGDQALGQPPVRAKRLPIW